MNCWRSAARLWASSAPSVASTCELPRRTSWPTWARRHPPTSQAGPDSELWEPSFHVANYAGATGSGDSAIAGFLAAYLCGHDAVGALRFASAVGGCNVTAPDALSGLRSWDETTAMIVGGWAKNPLVVDTPGWWVDGDGLWHGPHDLGAYAVALHA